MNNNINSILPLMEYSMIGNIIDSLTDREKMNFASTCTTLNEKVKIVFAGSFMRDFTALCSLYATDELIPIEALASIPEKIKYIPKVIPYIGDLIKNSPEYSKIKIEKMALGLSMNVMKQSFKYLDSIKY